MRMSFLRKNGGRTFYVFAQDRNHSADAAMSSHDGS